MTAAAFRDACAAQGRDGRPRLPAAGKTVGAHLARHDGRDAEGHRQYSAACSSRRRPRPGRGSRRNPWRLSRRKFVQTAGIGAGAALTSNIWGRGRENSVWSALRTDLQAVERGVICIASNENPVGPGKKVLDSLRDAARGRRQAGPLLEPERASSPRRSPRTSRSRPRTCSLSEGSTEILRAATQVFTSKTKALVGTIPDLRGMRRLRRADRQPGEGRQAQLRVQDRPRHDARRGEGRRPGVLLQPEQPDRHLRRRRRRRATSSRS